LKTSIEEGAQSAGNSVSRWSQILFFMGLIFALLPWTSVALALGLGLLLGLSGRNPFRLQTPDIARNLLQLSLVGLGFGMNLGEVLRVGWRSLIITALSITAVMLLGSALGRLLGMARRSTYLISVGTAICGGSAIAAVGPVVEASDEEMAVSLSTVFILNAVALVLFPVMGHVLGLTQTQFGLWTALAIHDTSSVVGAGLRYGPVALAIGVTVKLARALWIVPICLGTAVARRRAARAPKPWFIGGFILAAVFSTYLPAGAPAYGLLGRLAKIGMAVTLYLIGANISRAALKLVGLRPLLQGLMLWFIVASMSLALIYAGLIKL
jgi:uncharacterized integral membrane protein (TIGR00698 family)